MTPMDFDRSSSIRSARALARRSSTQHATPCRRPTGSPRPSLPTCSITQWPSNHGTTTSRGPIHRSDGIRSRSCRPTRHIPLLSISWMPASCAPMLRRAGSSSSLPSPSTVGTRSSSHRAPGSPRCATTGSSSATAQWQVLGRVPDRCGSLHLVKQVSAVFGQQVSVPVAPVGDAVVARFVELPLSFRYTLSSLFFRPPTVSITTSAGSYRFIVATAADLHLLRPSSTLGYSVPFSPSDLSSVGLVGGGVTQGTGRYRIDFYTMRVPRG